MKHIKVYESFNEMTGVGIDQLRKLIESSLVKEPKTPIILVTREEKPGLIKLLTEMTEEVNQDMIYINLDSKMGPVDVLPLFPTDGGLDDEGGMIFLEGIENSSPSIKNKVFGVGSSPGKLMDGTVSSKWLVVIKTPSTLAIPSSDLVKKSIVLNLR